MKKNEYKNNNKIIYNYILLKMFYLLLKINPIISECDKDIPILKGGSCVFDYCS